VAWVCVGNEPLGSWYNHAYDALLVPAVTNVANAFKQAGLAIGVTVPQNFEFMQVSYPPSQGSVKPELANIIKGTCAVMRSTRAPFMVTPTRSSPAFRIGVLCRWTIASLPLHQTNG